MAFRIVHSGNTLPMSFICDPSVSFQAGQLAELTVMGNQVLATVSNGLAPIGIIDDYRTKAFSNVSWNETVIVPCAGVVGPGGAIITPVDVKTELKKPNIIKSSFSSTVNCILNDINGVITFVAGTKLNFDLTGGGTPNAIRAIVNYSYYVANIPGDDTTAGSGRITVWYQRFFFDTTMYETNQQYPVRANLFCSELGLLTTRQPSENHPAIAMVCSPPSPTSPALQAMWY